MKKSVTVPTQVLEFLGFRLNSHRMTISLPGHKLHALWKLSRRVMKKERVRVQEVARLLGTMVAAHPAILPAPTYYRHAPGEIEGTGSEERPHLPDRNSCHARGKNGSPMVVREINASQ